MLLPQKEKNSLNKSVPVVYSENEQRCGANARPGVKSFG
jgi:hypothetical protein